MSDAVYFGDYEHLWPIVVLAAWATVQFDASVCSLPDAGQRAPDPRPT